MCGILGVFKPSGLDPEKTRLRLKKAASLLRHRGPDASGVVVRGGAGIALAHTRLAILDLDRRSDQPMASADGKLIVSFNGEIYNFRELRAELSARGARFRTEGDTEVLLEGYRAWGIERLLGRLAGMFAFALFDEEKGRLVLARDRFGKKPLFHSETAGSLVFASELKALWSLGARREIDPEGLDAYLALKFTPPPKTLVAGVSKIAPGCYLEKDRKGSRIRRYWDPIKHRESMDGDVLERLDAALSTAVQRRLVSDVPVCLFLSGGIDSSLIAAYAAERAGPPLTAYSIGYSDLPRYNEFEYSRLVAKRFGLRYEEIRMDSKQVMRELEKDSSSLDEPISDWAWLPLDLLSRRAAADGFKVALVGEGSDELFFGYDVMMSGLADLKRFETPLWRSAAAVFSKVLAPVYRRAHRGHRRYDRFRRAAAGEPVYMGSSVGYGKSQRHQVAGPRLLDSGDPEAGTKFITSLYDDYRRGAVDPSDRVNLLSYVEVYTKMSEVLLTRVDRVSMRHSLEARSPFLDHELAELAFAIPGEVKIRGGRLKGLLKDLARTRLPAEIVDRKKTGFSFPFKEWLRGDLGGVVESRFRGSGLFRDGWVNGDFCMRLLKEHRAGWIDHAPRLWTLFDLCRWYDRWISSGASCAP